MGCLCLNRRASLNTWILSSIGRTRFVLCIDNQGYPVSLESGKLYRALDDDPDRHGLLRIVDESGKDYLYPAELFDSVAVPEGVAAQLAA